MTKMSVGILPYSPGGNPYQRLVAESMESAGIDVVRIPNRTFMPISHALSLPIDVLHMHWPHSFYIGRTWLNTRIKRVMYAMGLRKLRRHPFVYSLENLIPHDSTDEKEAIRIVQRLIDCCDGVVAMSGAAEGILRETYRVPDHTRVAVIPHGNYIGEYPNEISREEARRTLGLPESAKVVLSLGRIRRYKGLDLLIDAYRKGATSDSVLFIAGDGEDGALVAELKELARAATAEGARVEIHPGQVPDEDMQIYFNASDIIALPYRDAPMNPGGLLLAMSFGRCVVAPRKGSIPETACPEGYFGYDEADPEGLPSAINEALSQDDLQDRGRTTLEHARVHHDWREFGKLYRKLYEDILGRA
jgi:beta-1,4-mannosyltransferase